MVKFYREYPEIKIVQTASAQIPWSHNSEILRVKSQKQRLWYINKTIENGWSVNVLAHQIDTNLYARQIEQKKVIKNLCNCKLLINIFNFICKKIIKMQINVQN